MDRNTLRLNGRRSNRAILGVAVVILLAVLGLSYRQWEQYKSANTDAGHARQVVDSVDRLLSDLIDAETGQRGYLLTGENRYLEPYNRAAQAIPSELGMTMKFLAARPSE